MILDPLVEPFQLLFLGLAGDPANHGGYRRGRRGRRARQPLRIAMKKLFEPLVGFGREQLLTGFKEVGITLDRPECRIHRNPLRSQRAGVLRFDLGEVILGQAVADGEVGVLGQKAEIRQRVDLGPVVVTAVKLRLREDVVHSRLLILPSMLALSGRPVPQSQASPMRVSM